MDMLIKYLPCKVVCITSSLCSNILLWTSKLKDKPKQQYPQAKNKSDLQVGLKTLIHPKQKLPPRVVHCYNMAPMLKQPLSLPLLLRPLPLPPQPRLSSLWSSSPYVLQPTVMGDVIGTESGDCMMSEIEDYMETKPEPEPEPEPDSSRTKRNRISGLREKSAMTREFPPSITLLRGTGRMPWVLERECSDDVRVTMTVIPEEDDDSVYCEECGYSMKEEEEEELRDFEFNEEPEGLERVDDEEEEEEEEVGFEFEEELVAKEGPNVLKKCSVEKKESELRGDLPKCFSFTYSGGFVQDSNSLWKGRIGDRNIGLIGQSGSAPLLQPMTPVM